MIMRRGLIHYGGKKIQNYTAKRTQTDEKKYRQNAKKDQVQRKSQ